MGMENIYNKFGREGIDGLIVSSPANISYLVKFKSRDSYLLISRKENIYFTDSRYIEEVRPLLAQRAILLKKINGSVFSLIANTCLELGLGQIGFEERYLAFAEYESLKAALKKRGRLIPTHSLIEELREIKGEEEVRKIKKAVKITAEALRFAKGLIKPGKKEIEVAAELERFITYCGAMDSAFDIIIASGPNSCFPHHISSQRKLKKDEPVMVDIGVECAGYKSDLTRMFFLGKITGLLRQIYDIVLQAQDKAIKRIKPGEKINEIDLSSRQFIAQAGFGEYFGHSLGHGIGLEVHEEPHISGKEKGELKPGMVFTIEPGIYLPGKFGIRIEDMVLVTEKGCDVLSGLVNK